MNASNYPDCFHPNGCSRRHFFQDGDLFIKANDGFFLVHKSVVCPVLQHVSDAITASGNGEPVVLNTNPRFLELLLQAIYERPWFCPLSLRHCLVLFAASRVYRAPIISSLCQSYLLEHLPTSFNHIDVVEQYREDAQVTVTVLSLCTSFRITPPLPWAFYALYVHLARAQAPSNPALVTPAVSELAGANREKLKALYRVAALAATRWNERARAFYETGCVQEWNFLADCVRKGKHQLPERCMLAISDISDPIRGMSEILGTCENEQLCGSCKDILRNEIAGFMRVIYAGICAAVGLPESKQDII